MTRAYIQRVRADRKRMRDLKRTLIESRRPERPEPLTRTEKCQKRRSRLLDERVPTRRCPLCGEIKLKSRQWVIVNSHVSEAVRAVGAVCRACFQSRRTE